MRGFISLPGTICPKPKRSTALEKVISWQRAANEARLADARRTISKGLKVRTGLQAGGHHAGGICFGCNHTRSLKALQASARRLREAVEAVKRRMVERERLVGRG